MEHVIEESFVQMIFGLSRTITATKIPHQYHATRGIPEAAASYEYLKALERNLTDPFVYPQFQYDGGRIDGVVVAKEGVIAFEGKGTLNGAVRASMEHEILRLDHWSVRDAITRRLSAPEGFSLWAVVVADTFNTADWWVNIHQHRPTWSLSFPACEALPGAPSRTQPTRVCPGGTCWGTRGLQPLHRLLT